MIRTLTGTISHHVSGGVILELNGVGYLIAVPARSVPVVGSSVTVFTHHRIREQEQSLYGFETFEELETFESLLDVPSIGPKSALAILSLASAGQIRDAVEREDVSFFSSVPGIGKKSAASIIVALTGKLSTPASHQSGRSELIEALTALGYRSSDIDPLLRNLPADVASTEAQVRWVLGQLRRH